MVAGLAVHSVQDVEGLEAKQRAISPLPFLDDRIRFLLFRELFFVFFPVFPVAFPVFHLIFRRHLGGGGRGGRGGRRERERRQRSCSESPSEGRAQRVAAPLRVNRFATKR